MIDMRELSPDAPRATNMQERCPNRSYARPDKRCILKAEHHRQGFAYCQFDPQPEVCEAAVNCGFDPAGGEPCRKPLHPGADTCREHAEFPNKVWLVATPERYQFKGDRSNWNVYDDNSLDEDCIQGHGSTRAGAVNDFLVQWEEKYGLVPVIEWKEPKHA